jgi:DNA-binding NarL/FixJ family response regulator
VAGIRSASRATTDGRRTGGTGAGAVALASPPLVGRSEELELIASALADAGRYGVLLAGRPGVGKTRLAREAADAAAAGGVVAEWTTATRASASVPFGALLPLIPLDDETAASDRITLYRRVQRALSERGGGSPVLLTVDDAHLLDDAAAALLLHLAQVGAVRLVLTARTQEPAPDPVVGLWKDGLVTRIEVQALSRHETGELIWGLLGGPAEGATVDHVWEATAGNALFVREVLLDAHASRDLVVADGLWRWRSRAGPGSRLVELVGARLGVLEPAVRRVVEVLAVGEPLGVVEVEAMTEPEALHAAERVGCVVVEQDGRRRTARLAHPLYADVIRTSLTDGESKAIRRGLAAGLESFGYRRHGDLFRLATWWLQTGSAGDPDLLVAASEQAIALDTGLALQLAEAATRANAGFRPRLTLAWALARAGRNDEACEVASSLADLATTDGDRVAAADVLANTLMYGPRDMVAAETALADVADLAPGASRALIEGRRAQLLFATGRLDEGLAAAVGVIDEPAAPPGAVLRAGSHAAMCLANRGELARARSIIARLRPLGFERAAADPLQACEVFAADVMAHALAGELDAAERALEPLDTLAATGANEFAREWRLLLAGRVALLRGAVQDARRLLGDAVLAGRDHPIGVLLTWALGLLAEASALSGDPDAARAAVAEIEAQLSRGVGLATADVLRAVAWATAGQGEVSRAAAAALGAADAAQEIGLRCAAVLGLHDALRLGERRGVAARIAGLAARCEGSLAETMAAHAAGVVAEDGHGLEAAARRFEAMGLQLHAAEAEVQAAQAFRRAGLRRRASDASARAEALRGRCQGGRTPALADLSTPVRLTRREREVAALAAQGLHNHDIAVRLSVSVRTVEGHLYQAYVKLGVGARDQLADALGLAENR